MIPPPDGTASEVSQWDTLWLGGARIPGIARLTGDGIARKLDVKKQKGKAGASIEDEGDEPAKFDAEIFLWNGQLLAEFESIKEDINPRKRGGKKYVLDIYHPAAAFLGIDRCYLTSIGMPDHDKRQGTVRIRLSFLEWFPDPPPQKPAGGGVKGKGAWNGYQGARQANVTAYHPSDGIPPDSDASDWVSDTAGDAANAIANWFDD